MENVSLDQKIEAVLFYKAAPVSAKTLIKLFDIDQTTLQAALNALATRLNNNSALRLLITDTTVTLVTAPELSTTIDQMRKEEMKRDIGKAGAETLSIVLYRGPIARTDIDRIRGVNCGYILRNLQIRGLVEKTSNPKRVEYQITPTLLQHLGITHKSQLPQYEDILNRLDNYEQTTANEA